MFKSVRRKFKYVFLLHVAHLGLCPDDPLLKGLPMTHFSDVDGLQEATAALHATDRKGKREGGCSEWEDDLNHNSAHNGRRQNLYHDGKPFFLSANKSLPITFWKLL